jgi:hypothetical protein
MEGLNILLVPGAVFLLSRPNSGAEIIALATASLATAIFLVVGTLFWHGLGRKLRHGDPGPLHRAMAFADRAERPGLIVTGLAALAMFWALSEEGLSGAVIGAAVLTLLAVLEWVNYYRRQLQHFDNGADFRRLLTGKGFRRSHMRRELAAFRRRRKNQAHAGRS